MRDAVLAQELGQVAQPVPDRQVIPQQALVFVLDRAHAARNARIHFLEQRSVKVNRSRIPAHLDDGRHLDELVEGRNRRGRCWLRCMISSHSWDASLLKRATSLELALVQ